MAEQILDKIVKTKIIDGDFEKWFLRQFATVNTPIKCCLDEFGVFFLNSIHKQTDDVLQTIISNKTINTNYVSCNLYESTQNATASTSCHNLSSYSDTSLEKTTDLDDSLVLKSTSNTQKKTRTQTQTQKSFDEKNFSPPVNPNFESRFLNKTSTPIKNNNKSLDAYNSSNSNKASNFKSKPTSSICLGDFVNTSRRKQKQSKNQKSSSVGSVEPKTSTNKTNKPAKVRIKPLTISKSVGDGFYNPAFCEDKSNLCSPDKKKPIDSKSPKDFKAESVTKNKTTIISDEQKSSSSSKTNLNVDLTHVANREVIDKFVKVYTILIDFNIVTNLLNELSYLFNIINCEDVSIDLTADIENILSRNPKIKSDQSSNPFQIFLKTLPNCIYFAVNALTKQKNMLALFDLQTLRVILGFPRFPQLAKDLTQFLNDVYEKKTNLQSTRSKHEASFPVGNTFTNVSYQEENDTRHNFPTANEFGAFKKQRDLFYKILKIWEIKHLNLKWSFEGELKTKIQLLFEVSQHPINMAHLSRLFVSQLIISSNFSEKPSDLGINTNLDMPKLSKLQQRLVTVGNFSTNYQFPGQQMFFKDFLLTANSNVFTEQIKMAFIAELIEYNDSSYEIININDKTNETSETTNEYIVRPEIITNMKIVAKFLGLITAQPFLYDHKISSAIDKTQIELRNLLTPSFDVIKILKKSIIEQKLLITIPWLVQYIAMLDYITLQLDYYQNLIELLFELYSNIGLPSQTNILKMKPTSIFILKTSLGWLFDNSNISSDYYNYRINRKQLTSILFAEMQPLSILLPNFNSYPDFQANEQFVVSNLTKNKKGETQLTLINSDSYNSSLTEKQQEINLSTHINFDPLLEKVVNVSCPFLAEFRVTIMPSNLSKSVSRSGTLRHVSTKVSNFPENLKSIQKNQDTQSKLIDTFLHSQSLSVRRIIEFVIERTTSAVIKDFQMETLLPSKMEANEKINKIYLRDLPDIINEIRSIYLEAFNLMILKFEESIPKMIESRAQQSLNALLPNETHPVVKKTCLSLILQKCKLKTDEWRYTNLKNLNFYAIDIQSVANKLIKSRSAKVNSTVLEIKREGISIAQIFDELQYWLHTTNFKPELVDPIKINAFLERYLDSLTGNCLPDVLFRTTAVMSINLIQNLIENHSNLVTDDLIKRFLNIWQHKDLKTFVEIPRNFAFCSTLNKNLNIFDTLIVPQFIRALGENEIAFDHLALLLINLINCNLLSVDYLNELFLKLYKYDWPDNVLKEISRVLDKVLKESKPNSHNSGNDSRSRAVMEVLADLVRDVDEY